ncbi:hypothetical protein ZIOFF_039654 [Zingiber officinale]|uniref:Uncharacterized protein n=1 Tax=Zingiber officinale TaxID=94328 RepID=A0A8J5L400_ZINOF|nr:hypothetical protein ZIOFF_039654 [Zingiber officinale]
MSAASLVCFHSLISGAVEHRLMSRVKQKHWNQNCSLKISASLSDQSFQPAAKSLPITSKKLLDSVKWDSEGLAITVVRDMDNGAVLMAGFVDKEALAVTSVSRKPTFYKGPSSTDFINVHDIFLECDHDSIIYLGKSVKPTIYDCLADPEVEICLLKNGKPSWTKRKFPCSKVREEISELVETCLQNEDKTLTAVEFANLAVHVHELLLYKNHVKMEKVIKILEKGFSQLCIQEINW